MREPARSAGRISFGLRRRPADRHDESVRDCELGFGQPRCRATADHVQSSGSGLFDVLGEIQRLRDEPVARHGAVRDAQLLERQLRRQATGIPDLQPVREEHHLHAAVACVIAMRYRVHDGLRHNFDRNLVSDRCLWAMGASAHRPVDLAEHEIGRLVHQFKDSAPVHLERGDGLLHLDTVETEALDLGRQQEALGRLAEQHHGGVRGPTVAQQVQMLEKMMRSDGLGERESSRVARRLNESFHPLGVKIVQARAIASRGVERSPSNPLGYIQIPHQGRVESRDEIVCGIEALPDQSGLRPVDQRLHLGMPAACSGSLHENQTVRPGNRCLVELALRRGNPFRVLASVFLAEQPDIDIAALGFF